MRILFVIPSLKRAGAERLLVNICNELSRDENHSVAIFLISDENEYASELNEKTIVLGGQTSFHFSLYRKDRIVNSKYINFVNEFKPDVIHSHSHFADLLTHSYRSDDSIYVSHIHNSEIEVSDGIVLRRFFEKSIWTNFYEFQWLLKRFKRFGTNFIACSEGAGGYHKKRIGIGKVKVIPNAIPMPQLVDNDKKMKDVPTLIWVGRFTDVKRPQLAIKIAHKLKNSGLSFKLQLIGAGAELQACEKLINDFNLEAEVELLGLVENMERVYKHADLMIHTSLYEGLPMVFLEAMSNGIPIITTDCLPNNELIEDKVNGCIVKSTEPKDFVEMILEIKNSPEYFSSLSKNAIDTSHLFGIEPYTKKMLDFYTEIIGSKN